MLVFCFISSTLEIFPFEDFFHPGKQKRSHLGQDWVNMEGGAQGSGCFFGQKLLTTQHSVDRCACKSPIMKGANTHQKSLQKIFTEAKHSLSQQCQLVH